MRFSMKHSATQRAATLVACIALAATALFGCATTRSINPESDIHYDASYDFADKKLIVDHLSNSLLNFVDDTSIRPTVISYGIGNQTSEHINTGGITDDIRLALVQSRRYQFINETQRVSIAKESSHQRSGNVAAADRIIAGRQLGADYILSGTLRSIVKKEPRQIRLNKKKLVYYSLNLELTDVNTGAVTWADKVEIAREQSKPIIGW